MPDSELELFIKKNIGEGGAIDMTPLGIIKRLGLRKPIYKKSAAYGHFGRNEKEFTWEKLDLVKLFNKL